MHQDRYYGYVDKAILFDVRAGKGHGFSQEADLQAWATAMLLKVTGKPSSTSSMSNAP
jgi:hypothetical protein